MEQQTIALADVPTVKLELNVIQVQSLHNLLMGLPYNQVVGLVEVVSAQILPQMDAIKEKITNTITAEVVEDTNVEPTPLIVETAE